MGSKYTANSISGYNSSPPSDDGSQTEANRTKWSSVKTKLSDPIKTLAEAIDTALQNAFNYGPNSQSGAYVVLATDHDKTIQCTGAGGVTLIDAATGGAGFTVTISNQHTAAIAVARAGSDVINSAGTSWTIQPGAAVRFVVKAAANGWLAYPYLPTDDGSTMAGAYTWAGMQTFTAGITLSGTASNIALGSNYISNGGTDAGLSFDTSNNATFSDTLAVTGIASFAAGAAATPSIARTGDLNTGLWFPAADTLAGSTAGNEVFRFDSSGILTVKSSGTHIIGTADTADVTLQLGPTTPGSGRSGRIAFITSSTNKNFFIASNWLAGGQIDFCASTASGGATMSSSALMTLFATGKVAHTSSENYYPVVLSQTNATQNWGILLTTTADANGADATLIDMNCNANRRFAVDSNGGIRNYSANNVNLSDIRTKDVFEDYTDELLDELEQKFIALRRGRFKYNDQTHDDWNYGKSAQSVAEHLPELVGVWNPDKPEGEQLLCEYAHDIEQIGEALLVRALKRISSIEAKLGATQ